MTNANVEKKQKRKKNEKHRNKSYTEIQSYKNEIIIGEKRVFFTKKTILT